MAKRSKSYRAAAEKIHAGEIYAPLAAMQLAKDTAITKFDSTVEVTFRLGVDPRKADQMIRGTVTLPHGTGKTSRVLVFAVGERAQEALDAGADEVGGDELIEKVAGGYTTAKAVREIKGGRIEFRIDKHANLAFIIGKASFTAEQLTENYAAVLEEVLRLKPSAAKGRYISKGTVATTMGPGIPLDVTKTRDLLSEDAS